MSNVLNLIPTVVQKQVVGMLKKALFKEGAKCVLLSMSDDENAVHGFGAEILKDDPRETHKKDWAIANEITSRLMREKAQLEHKLKLRDATIKEMIADKLNTKNN